MKFKINIYKIIGVLLPILVWEALSTLVINIYLPSIFGVLQGTLLSIKPNIFLFNTFYTLAKTLVAFCVANIIGVTFGYLFSLNHSVAEFFDFGIDFMRSIPVVAMFPVFLIVFGENDFSKVLLVTFGIFLIVFFATIRSLSTISQSKLNIFLAQGANEFTIFIHYIRFILISNFFATAKVTLSICLYLTATLEILLGSQYGVGKLIVVAKDYYNINEMYFWIITIGLIGYFLNKIVSGIEKYFGFQIPKNSKLP
jgi:NitT/TauT family transport system permease protein